MPKNSTSNPSRRSTPRPQPKYIDFTLYIDRVLEEIFPELSIPRSP